MTRPSDTQLNPNLSDSFLSELAILAAQIQQGMVEEPAATGRNNRPPVAQRQKMTRLSAANKRFSTLLKQRLSSQWCRRLCLIPIAVIIIIFGIPNLVALSRMVVMPRLSAQPVSAVPAVPGYTVQNAAEDLKRSGVLLASLSKTSGSAKESLQPGVSPVSAEPANGLLVETKSITESISVSGFPTINSPRTALICESERAALPSFFTEFTVPVPKNNENAELCALG